MPKLFETVQITVATCGQAAVFGTTATPARFYAEWKSAWPRTDFELERELGHAPTPQELLHGLLTPESEVERLIPDYESRRQELRSVGPDFEW
jgi:type I restriction enzyme R subunit